VQGDQVVVDIGVIGLACKDLTRTSLLGLLYEYELSNALKENNIQAL